MHAESLAERYAHLAQEAPGRRGIDLTLRSLDLALAASMLVILSPLWLAIAAVIAASGGRPIFYRGLRVGLGGRVFTMLKFRTLEPDADARLGTYYGDELTRRTAAEVTRVGRWLRATQLDEIAQLWNVLRGEMSFVGPRPIRPTFFEQLVGEIPQYWQRLVVRPGLTGFAQTRMGREESWAEKLAHDLEWIADRSLRLYLRTVAATGWRMLAQLWNELLRRGLTGGALYDDAPMTEGRPRDRQTELQRRRALRRRQVRRRRAIALAALVTIAAAVAVPLALSGGTGAETAAPSAPATPRSKPKPERHARTSAGSDGTLGDRAVERSCELLSRAQIAAQFGGPVGRPIATWPSCRWDVGNESFVSLRYAPQAPIATTRRRAYVLKSVAGLASDAFFGTDRALYFGDAGGSFRLLYERASEFTGIREPQLIALAREALARTGTGAKAPGSSTPKTAPARAGKPLTVYFAGDSLAAGPGWAFLVLEEGKPRIAARAEYEVGTGLLRSDYFDWVRHLRGIVAGTDPQVVVFMGGANDSQDAIVNGRYYPVGTSVWDRVYRARVAAAMDAAGAGGRKVIWVGMPPMRDATLSRGMGAVDAVYRSEAARRPNVTYLDTWSLFDGPGGGYADQVADGTGRYVYARLPDGIHLNVEGSQLLARAVAKAVLRAGRAGTGRN